MHYMARFKFADQSLFEDFDYSDFTETLYAD